MLVTMLLHAAQDWGGAQRTEHSPLQLVLGWEKSFFVLPRFFKKLVFKDKSNKYGWHTYSRKTRLKYLLNFRIRLAEDQRKLTCSGPSVVVWTAVPHKRTTPTHFDSPVLKHADDVFSNMDPCMGAWEVLGVKHIVLLFEGFWLDPVSWLGWWWMKDEMKRGR